MANVNVKKALDRILRDAEKTQKHVTLYSGVDTKDAQAIDTACAQIIEEIARIAQHARTASGSKEKDLVKVIRKALGYTYP